MSSVADADADADADAGVRWEEWIESVLLSARAMQVVCGGGGGGGAVGLVEGEARSWRERESGMTIAAGVIGPEEVVDVDDPLGRVRD